MTTLARQTGAMPIDDPFVLPSPTEKQRHRYSGFDPNQFALYNGGSPSHIKSALEAHLAETDRRLQDASHIGSVLVKQRQDLADRIRDIDTTTNGHDIPPELRQKVASLEKEVAEISRETARIFVPRNRLASGDAPLEPAGSVLSSQAQHSPTKVHAPTSRKARNQPSTRLNDVKLATALTDTLLTQMRDLQAAFAEREEALKHANHQNATLDADVEALRGKVRALDDSEQRFKDENWSLQTQVSELLASQEEAAERERRLTVNWNASKAQHDSVQREFEELKQSHNNLSDEHSNIKKQHDVELGALRRNANTSENEVDNLRKKVDDLTSQNKELAKAFAARLREGERVASQQFAYVPPSAEDEQDTPEHSPPPSPSKGTPRHGALESETLKSSLHHAQRMIQHLKNNIHREKTEKFELKKLLQEARDDLESKRKGDSAGKTKRNSKQSDVKKQARQDRLGAARNSKDEIVLDDQEWEDSDMMDTPSKGTNRSANPRVADLPAAKGQIMPGAYADTATETSDAFESANENNTETEAFQTPVETLDGHSDTEELTETDQKTPTDPSHPRTTAMSRISFRSTASTSDDDDDTTLPFQTPMHKPQTPFTKTRVTSLSRSLRSPPSSGDQSMASQVQSPPQDSPASITSSIGTPVQGMSLFAELDGLSDDGTEASATPQSQLDSSRNNSPLLSRRSVIAPSRLRSVHSHEGRTAMVDASTTTDDLPLPDNFSKQANGPQAVIVDQNESTDVPVQTETGESTLPNQPLVSSAVEAQEALSELQPTPAAEAVVVSHISSEQAKPLAKEVPLSRSNIITCETLPVLSQLPKTAPFSYQRTISVDSIPTLKETVDHGTETDTAAIPTFRFSPLSSQESIPDRAARQDSIQSIGVASIARSYSPSSVLSLDTAPAAASNTSEALATAGTATVALGAMAAAGNASRRNRGKRAPIYIAEDETSQPVPASNSELSVSDSERTPFQNVDGNAATAQSPVTSIVQIPALHESTQTRLSGADIENLFTAQANKHNQSQVPPVVVNAETSPRRAREPTKRASSPASNRSARSSPPPPLPAEAKTVIAAQRASNQLSSLGAPAPGSMGPPIMPASAYRRGHSTRSSLGAPAQLTSKPTTPTAGRSVASTPMSRRSSASSFATELDQRFNMGSQSGTLDMSSTNPRILRALTETMLGEWMYKYTSGSGADGASNNRHQRFFWVHPYTLTLYWSTERPQESNKKKGKASAVSISAVQSVQDDNGHPPGLHNKSILIETPHRTIKMTAPTAERHETWMTALTYLLLKQQKQDNDVDDTDAEDIADFDPNARSASRTTHRSRTTVSTRTSRAGMVQRPTLHAAPRRSQSVEPLSLSNRFSAVFRTPQSFRGSRSSRYSQAAHDVAHTTDATPAETPTATTRNSADELSRHVDAHERPAFRMENVRACCDGKHDVGSLSHTPRAGGSKSHRVSFGPSLSSNASTTHRRHNSDANTVTRRQHLEMDPANLVDDSDHQTLS